MTIMQTESKYGALSAHLIRELIKAGSLSGASDENVRLSSLDLSLSDEVYKVDGVFQPYRGESIRDVLSLVKKEKHDITEPLERNQMYIARLNESFSLPSSVYGFCNPKSTTGRLDIHVRLIADGVPRYDSITPAGWSGELWVSIVPKTFPVRVRKGQSLNQIRFFNADTRLSDLELELFSKKGSLICDSEGSHLPLDSFMTLDNDGSVILTLDGGEGVIGWRAIPQNTPLDMSKVGAYAASDYFVPLKKENGYIHLKKNEFYILSTRESVRVPPELSCEMVPMDERSGEFRSHYAGFIDPGWGWGSNGEEAGRPLTLEVRPFEDLVARDGQPIAKIRFERVAGQIEEGYDTLDSNYVVQDGPRLAKQFKT